MVAHGFELADGVASRFLGVEPGEVVPAGMAVAGGGRGDVPDRNQQCTSLQSSRPVQCFPPAHVAV